MGSLLQRWSYLTGTIGHLAFIGAVHRSRTLGRTLEPYILSPLFRVFLSFGPGSERDLSTTLGLD
jgi:hypothetical protein